MGKDFDDVLIFLVVGAAVLSLVVPVLIFTFNSLRCV